MKVEKSVPGANSSTPPSPEPQGSSCEVAKGTRRQAQRHAGPRDCSLAEVTDDALSADVSETLTAERLSAMCEPLVGEGTHSHPRHTCRGAVHVLCTPKHTILYPNSSHLELTTLRAQALKACSPTHSPPLPAKSLPKNKPPTPAQLPGPASRTPHNRLRVGDVTPRQHAAAALSPARHAQIHTHTASHMCTHTHTSTP